MAYRVYPIACACPDNSHPKPIPGLHQSCDGVDHGQPARRILGRRHFQSLVSRSDLTLPAVPHDAPCSTLLQGTTRASMLIRDHLPQKLAELVSEELAELIDGGYANAAQQANQRDRSFNVRQRCKAITTILPVTFQVTSVERYGHGSVDFPTDVCLACSFAAVWFRELVGAVS